MPLNDPIVKEVHNAREILAKKCNYNVHAIGQMLKEGDEKCRAEGWKVISKEELDLMYK